MSELRKRLLIFVSVLLVALLFLFPTLRVAAIRLTGGEVSSESLLKFQGVSRPITLGLDLSGGVHLLYQVVTEEAVTSRLKVTANTLRLELRKEKVPVLKAQVNPRNEIELVLLSERTVARAQKLIEDSNNNLIAGETKIGDDGRPVLIYRISDQEAGEMKRGAVVQAVETLRNRIDKFGVTEPLIQRVGEDRVLLQMPGVDDIEAVKKVVGRVAKLEFRLLSSDTSNSVTLKDREGDPVLVEDTIQLTGEAVKDARVGSDELGRREVSLTFTSEGGRVFSKITGANVGRNLAIILDGVVYSSPVIQEKISGGRCSITGNYGYEEARELAVVLKAGALPASLEVLQERTVGPSLGAESIKKGLTAIAISFAMVIVFMTLYYRKSGIVAVGTLVINVFLVLALLSAFGATLTLPGLAGLALTVGMAVDANVIIFERIREEIRSGAGRDAAVNGGFGKAYSAIIDSNITTLLAGIVLYYFGSGPIRGFAVTLSIGIFTTIFCAIFVARLAFDALSLKGRRGSLSI